MDQCCYTLEIFRDAPSQFLNQQGAITIPSASNQSLKRISNRSELTDASTVEFNATVTLAIPFSKAAHYAFKDYFDPHVIFDKKTPIRANIRKGASTLPQHYLKPLQKNDQSKKYIVAVSYEADHWVLNLKARDLCDLYNEEVEITKDYISQEWGNELYNSGDYGIMFPPADYGNLQQTPRPHFGIPNFRPWINALNFLERAFCKGGWKVKGDILQTEWFRRQWIYAAANPVNVNLAPFLANIIESDYNVGTGEFHNLDVDEDPDSTINGSQFTGTGLYCFNINLRLIIPAENANLVLNLELVKKDIYGNDYVVQSIPYNTITASGGNYILSIDQLSNEVFLNNGESLCFRTTTNFNGFTSDVNIEGLINNIVKDVYLYEGSIVNLKDYITCEKTALDILKGILHQSCLIPDTDEINKCVTFYPACTVNVCGQIIEGYEKTEPIDISELVACNSKKSTLPNNFDGNRFCVYGFKESTDPFITETTGYDGDAMPFDLTVDVGSGKNDTDYKRNPVFEPTLTRKIVTTGFNINGNFFTTVSPPFKAELPVLTDNTDGNFSTDIGCRIMTFENANGNNGQISFCGEMRTDFPIAWNDQNQTGNDEQSECNSSYTDPHVELLYKKKTLRDLCSPTDVIQYQMSDAQYGFFSHREQYRFNYEGQPRTGHISNLVYDCCKHLATATIKYDTTAYLCLLPDDGIVCINNVQMTCVQNGDCYDFAYGGTQEITIYSVLWEWQYQNADGSWPSTWNNLGSSNTAQICSPTGVFRVRITLGFDDDCPDVTDITVKNPCSEYTPELIKTATQNAAGEWCIIWTLGGNIPSNPSDYTILNLYYTEGSDPTQIPYNFGDKINNPQDNLTIFLEIDFNDNCPPYPIIQDNCVIPPPNPTCGASDAIPVCLDTPDGITFTYQGTFAIPPKWIKYWYTCDEFDGVALWTPNDDAITGCTNICVFLEAGFCDVCPIYCSEEVKCDTDSCLQNVMLAVDCSECDITPVVSNPNSESLAGYTYCWLSSDTQTGTFTIVQSGVLTGNTIPSFDDAPTGWYKLQLKKDGCPTIESQPYQFIKPNAGDDTTVTI